MLKKQRFILGSFLFALTTALAAGTGSVCSGVCGSSDLAAAPLSPL